MFKDNSTALLTSTIDFLIFPLKNECKKRISCLQQALIQSIIRMELKERIIIIGGGLSGLTLADLFSKKPGKQTVIKLFIRVY